MFESIFGKKTFSKRFIAKEEKAAIDFFMLLKESTEKKKRLCEGLKRETGSHDIKILRQDAKALLELTEKEMNSESFAKITLVFLSNTKKLYEALGKDIPYAAKDILSHEEKLIDIIRKEYPAAKSITEKVGLLKAIWEKELLLLRSKRKIGEEDQALKEGICCMVEQESGLADEIKLLFERLVHELKEEIRIYSEPTMGQMLEFDLDDTVESIKKRMRATMVSRRGYTVTCPACLDPDSALKENKKKKTYACTKCGCVLSEKEYDAVSRIENRKGVLLDFNIRKNIGGQLVLDHHDDYNKGDIMLTATAQVIMYIESVSENRRLSDFRLLRIFRQKIQEYAEEGKKRINVFADHLDIDMFLSHFAFRNPNLALKHKDLLIKLSQYGDMMKIDNSVKRHYLIMQGYFNHLRLMLEKRENIILEIMIRETGQIIERPGRYKRFEDEERIRLQTAKSMLSDFSRHFRPVPGYEKKLLEYISASDIKRVDAIYEIIMEKRGGAFNNPLIINLPLLIKTNPQKTSFSLAANPNREGFEKINLNVLKEPLENAETEKISRMIQKYSRIANSTHNHQRYDNNIKKLRECLKQNKKHNTWRIKPNLVIINPKSPSVMDYDEIMEIIKENIDKVGV